MTDRSPEAGANRVPIETQDDAALFALGGATFHMGVTLPSGRYLDNDEAHAFTSAFAGNDLSNDADRFPRRVPDTVILYGRAKRPRDDELVITGDPAVDGVLAVKQRMRAMAAQGAPVSPASPLAVEFDNWTDNPATNWRLLADRLAAATYMRRPEDHYDGRDPIGEWHAQRLRNFADAEARAAAERAASMSQGESRLRKWGTRLITFFRRDAE